jgi:hypothetical protein
MLETSMRLNTTKSVKLARQMKKRFHTWQGVREASQRENGVYVVRPDAKPAEKRPEEGPLPAGV